MMYKAWSRMVVVLVFLAVTAVYAQGVPKSITYQGKLTDSAGNPLTGSFTMQFKLWDTETGGTTPLWDSGELTIQVNNGLFTVALGTTENPINATALSAGDVWIEAQVGTDTPLPRAKLSSTPFALWAADLSLPFSRTVSSAETVLSLMNLGTGSTALFSINNSTSSSPALVASTDGTGPAARFLGLAEMSGFKLTALPGTGKVLTSDAEGIGTWQDLPTYSAGSGLALTGEVFSVAPGGVDGSMLADGAVTSLKIEDATIQLADIGQNSAATGQVIKWDGTAWVPADDGDATYTAGAGLRLTDSEFSIAPTGVTDSMLADGSVTGTKLAADAVDSSKIADGSIQLLDVGQNGAAVDQVIKWNGTAWVAASDANTTLSAGAGLELNGDTLSVADGGIATSMLAPGAVNLSKLADNAVTSAKVADGSLLPVDLGQAGALDGQILKWDDLSSAWVLSADDGGTSYTAGSGLVLIDSEFSIPFGGLSTEMLMDSSVTASKIADGSVSGIKLSPDSVDSTKIADGSILLADLGANGATAGQVIKRDPTNTAWILAPDSDISYSAGSGLDLTETTFSIASGGVSDSMLATGAVSTDKLADGSVTSAKVADGSLLPVDMGQAGASDGQVLKWNTLSSAWVPSDDTDTAYTAGQGLSLADSEFAVAAGGVTEAMLADDSVTGAKVLNGSLQLADLDADGATADQVIKWNGTAWVPAADESRAYSAGAGLSLADSEFSVAAGGVTESMLADSAVTTSKLADSSVDSIKIADGSILLTDLAQNGALDGQILRWDSSVSSWITVPDENTTYTAGAGLTLEGSTFSVSSGGIAAGMLAGDAVTSGNIEDGTIQFADIGTNGAVAGQVMKFDGTAWVPAADAIGSGGTGSYIIGAGLLLSGDELSVAPLGITSGMLADGSVTGSKVAIPLILSGSVAAEDGVVTVSNTGSGHAVKANAASGTAVMAYSESGTAGIFDQGMANTNPAVHAISRNNTDKVAIKAEGEVRVVYPDAVEGAANRAVPIAFGAIGADGTKASGTPNFTVVSNPETERCEITITKYDGTPEVYDNLNFVTVVTPVTEGGVAPNRAVTGAVDGKLFVEIWNVSGYRIPAAFHFIVYKP